MVFNTEAHAFPRFQLGKLFKTGWERKKRDSEKDISLEMKQEANRDEEANMQTTVASLTSTTSVEGSLGTEIDTAQMAAGTDVLANGQ